MGALNTTSSQGGLRCLFDGVEESNLRTGILPTAGATQEVYLISTKGPVEIEKKSALVIHGYTNGTTWVLRNTTGYGLSKVIARKISEE